jgi:alpha-D-xyloside xylohydrolase
MMSITADNRARSVRGMIRRQVIGLGMGVPHYAEEKPAGPIELRIYRGADGSLNLYQDSGDSYDYEKVAHSVIPLRWSESTRTLAIGDREGSYSQMPAAIQINIVWVSSGHGSGPAAVANPDKTIEYTGKAVSMQAPRDAWHNCDVSNRRR